MIDDMIKNLRNCILDYERDYIPDGGPVTKCKNIRRPTGLHRCSVIVVDDMQSGPLYCGKLAHFIADSVDTENPEKNLKYFAAVCKEHLYVLKELEVKDDVS